MAWLASSPSALLRDASARALRAGELEAVFLPARGMLGASLRHRGVELLRRVDGLDAAAAFGLGSMGFPFTVFTDSKGRIVTAYLGELHQPQADLILDAVVEVNAGTLSLEDAKTRIASGLKALGPTTPST